MFAARQGPTRPLCLCLARLSRRASITTSHNKAPTFTTCAPPWPICAALHRRPFAAGQASASSSGRHPAGQSNVPIRLGQSATSTHRRQWVKERRGRARGMPEARLLSVFVAHSWLNSSSPGPGARLCTLLEPGARATHMHLDFPRRTSPPNEQKLHRALSRRTMHFYLLFPLFFIYLFI